VRTACWREHGDVLACVHGHVLRVLAARWLGMAPAAGARFALATAAVSSLGYEHQTEVPTAWNCSRGDARHDAADTEQLTDAVNASRADR
jgi:broad specificity phosphatase PhoE